jgi:hypothetical protein
MRLVLVLPAHDSLRLVKSGPRSLMDHGWAMHWHDWRVLRAVGSGRAAGGNDALGLF